MIASDAGGSIFLQNIFIGIVLTATSVSITVETLKELGKLKTRSGNAILGAAIIDDILGIIALTIVTSLADSSVKLWVVLLKIVGFFVFSAVVGFIFYKVYKEWTESAPKSAQACYHCFRILPSDGIYSGRILWRSGHYRRVFAGLDYIQYPNPYSWRQSLIRCPICCFLRCFLPA